MVGRMTEKEAAVYQRLKTEVGSPITLTRLEGYSLLFMLENLLAEDRRAKNPPIPKLSYYDKSHLQNKGLHKI